MCKVDVRYHPLYVLAFSFLLDVGILQAARVPDVMAYIPIFDDIHH